jgi:hypothetical protein
MENHALVEIIPPPQAVRERLGRALRELKLLRRLLRLADLAEEFRSIDRHAREREGAGSCG